jgi:SAM-dependent methyltransferase
MSSASQAASSPRPETRLATEAGTAHSRHSHGLEQFAAQFQEAEAQFILDLGGATQANVGFVTSLGHRLYSEDFPRLLEGAFGARDGAAGEEISPALIDDFLRQNLDFPEAHFDGVLLWDALELLEPALLRAVVARLRRIAKPGSHLLAFFHADERAASVPVYSYQILDAATLRLAPRGTRRSGHVFNNRAVEKLFEGFQSVKFFLARDNLREVIVRR